MKLSELILVRDALLQAKNSLLEAALSQIHIKNSLYDRLQPAIDNLYLPIAKLNFIIDEQTKRIDVEVE
ncbi:hypothetical protein [Caudoviricetes sp.]|nr:hypothetical protein [Caudoviricetes sp.]